jgi:DNA-directed RNA polymerase subunit RPC12/RpoP
MEKLKCNECKKDFDYEIIEANGIGNKEKEEINCPYCGDEYRTLMTSGLVTTHRIPREFPA